MNKGFDEGIFLKNGQKNTLHCLKEQILKPGVCTLPHYHKYVEILYGIDCDVNIWIDDRLETFKSGDICFINPNETHFIYSGRGNNSYYVIKFFPEILSYDGQMLSEISYLLPILYKNGEFPHIIESNVLDLWNVEEIFRDVFTQWEREDMGFEFAIRGQILRLFSALLKVWGNLPNFQAFTPINDETALAIYRTAAYITQNCDNISAWQLSESLHMSYSHFSRTFKKVMGKSFSQFLTERRLDLAKKLLLTTSYSITEIAQRTGFSSASHLISNFRQQTGVTPYSYRKQIKPLEQQLH